MTTQTEMFPKTELDQAHVILIHLLNEEEKAETALDNAEKKVGECSGRVYKQRQVIAWLQDKMPPADPIVEGEEVIEDAEFLQIEGDVLDPITGEIVGKEALAEGLEPVVDAMLEDLKEEGVIMEPEQLIACPDCSGDGRLPDKTGGGHHRCKACDGSGKVPYMPAASPFVFAVYPGSGDSHKTEVGERTRYAELVSDYFSAAGIEGDVADWQVLAEDELTHNGGGERNLTEPIQPRDYGRCLIVAAANQGSAA